MSERAAFAPKERFSDPDCLGTIYVSDDGDLNVRDAVASDELLGPAGFIVTEDPAQIAALDHYEPVKRVAIPEPEPDGGELEALTKEQLLELPEADQVQGARQMRVDDLRRAIASAREGA